MRTSPRLGRAVPVAYPVAAGSLLPTLREYRPLNDALPRLSCKASPPTLISVAVRLVPLGQTDGLAVLRDLMPVIAATAARAATATLDDLGAATVGADIAAMKHETQYSRVFRS